MILNISNFIKPKINNVNINNILDMNKNELENSLQYSHRSYNENPFNSYNYSPRFISVNTLEKFLKPQQYNNKISIIIKPHKLRHKIT